MAAPVSIAFVVLVLALVVVEIRTVFLAVEFPCARRWLCRVRQVAWRVADAVGPGDGTGEPSCAPEAAGDGDGDHRGAGKARGRRGLSPWR